MNPAVLTETLGQPLTKAEERAVETAALRYLAHQQREVVGAYYAYETASDVLDRLHVSDRRWTELAGLVVERGNELASEGKAAPEPPKAPEPEPEPEPEEPADRRTYTDEEAEGMRAMRRCGYTLAEIAEEYGCGASTVSRATVGWDEAGEWVTRRMREWDERAGVEDNGHRHPHDVGDGEEL